VGPDELYNDPRKARSLSLSLQAGRSVFVAKLGQTARLPFR
jgi:hypothetical protein